MPPAKAEPGRDPEMAERTQHAERRLRAHLHRPARSTFSLMIWADYDREWKKYQIRVQRSSRCKRTEEQIQRGAGQGRRGAAAGRSRRSWPRARQEAAAAPRGDRASAQSELEQAATASGTRVDQDFRFTKAEIDVARYEYEEAVHQASRTRRGRKQKKLDELEQRWDELRLKLEDVNAGATAAAQAKLAELEKTRSTAEKAQKELLRGADAAGASACDTIQPGVRLLRAQPAGAGPGQPVAARSTRSCRPTSTTT